MPPVAFPTPQDPRQNYPFPNNPRRDDEYSEAGDHYDMNSSTTRLAGAPGFYDQNTGGYSRSSFSYLLLTSPGDAGSEIFNRRYEGSVDSHSSIPSISPFADPALTSSEHYPAWSADRQIPMSTEEIEDIFLDLAQKFGFQNDSMRNMVGFAHFVINMH